MATGGFLRPKLSAWGALDAAGFLAAAATLAALFSSIGWPIELAAHFRVQYFAVSAALAAASALGRRYRIGVALAAVAAVNGIIVSPAFGPAVSIAGAGRAPLRVMLLNVHTANRAHDDVLRVVRELAPQIVLFEEVDERWLAALRELSSDWPFSVHESREDNFGIALFSRLPLDDARIVHIGRANVPSVTARVSFDGMRVSLLGTHPLPPASRPYTELRDDQLHEIAKLLSQLPPPRVVLGDLNTSPWSHAFHRLVEAGDLRDSGTGWGLQPTWPTSFWPLLVPIDHCLHSAELSVVHRRIGPFVGSDHYPLIVDLAAAGPRAAGLAELGGSPGS